MLSFRDGRCDAKDGVATDRQSLLRSELAELGQFRADLAVWGAATLHFVAVDEERQRVPWYEDLFCTCHTSQMACAIHNGGWWQRGREDQSHGMAGHRVVSR